MKQTEYHPARLGVFVVGAILLAVAALVLWGPLLDLWQKRYVIFFDETATGLDAGATVRLNGVAIGKVDSIDLFYDQSNKVYTAVVAQLDPNKVKRISKGGLSFDDMLKNRDIFAQLGIAGVVSLKLEVALDVGRLRPGEYREWNNDDYKKYYGDRDWIPAKQSTIAKVIAKLEEVLNNEGITNLISSVGRLLDESTTNHLVFKTSEAIDAYRVLATNANEILLTNKEQIRLTISNLARLSATAGPGLDQTFAKLGGAADSIQTNMVAFSSGIDQMATNFAGVSTNFAILSGNLNNSLANLDVILRGAAPLPPEASETLHRLQDTIESLQRLIDYVERHPDSLWRGRAKEK